ncbi:protein EPIDERMAL PATTERNING FACTOR 2 isoform X2 [Fagus crenata]
MKILYLGAHTCVLLMIFFMLPTSSRCLRVAHHFSLHDKGTNFGDQTHVSPKEEAKEELLTELYPTGSSLPDCSHACGPCFPCKRVMVSFRCFTESCPIVYRCMCRGKYYHVPSN